MEQSASPYKVHVFVCTNCRDDGRPSCGVRGAAVRAALKTAVKERYPDKSVRVSQSGCLGWCAQGPNVVAYPAGIRWSAVTEEDVPAVLEAVGALRAADPGAEPR